jgi:hypothetical protein
MDCPEASERLPWYLNGSLEARERADVEAHLGGCAACGEELARTRNLSEAFGVHVPKETIVALAAGAGLDAAEDSAARAHLDSCPLCIEDLALARESARAIEAASAPVTARPLVRRAQMWSAAAASVAAAFVAGVLASRMSGSVGDDERRRVASLESEVVDLRRESDRAQTLERELLDLRGVQANVPLLELLPRERASRRAHEAEAPVLRAGGAFAAVSLVEDSGARYDDHRLELTDASGRTLWTRDGLARQPAGDFTALIPLASLGEGRHVLRLSGRRGETWKPVASYAFDFRPR